MKTILFLSVMFLLSNISTAQPSIGYKYNYEISIEANRLSDKKPKDIVREFIDYVFEEQNEKFNVQTRYNQKGIFYVSSNNKIDERIVEKYFELKKSTVLSFKESKESGFSKTTEVSFVQN